VGFRKRNDKPELPDEFASELVTTVYLDEIPIRLVRMNQLPVMRVLPVMSEQDPNKQMLLIMDLIKSALMEPDDWDKHIAGISIDGLTNVMAQWAKTLPGEEEANGKKKRR
jgi:hypothetical protein